MVAAFAIPLQKSFAATDQLRVALNHEPPDLDPTAGDDPATLAVSYQNIFEGLTRIDARGMVQPALAKSWTIADDKLSHVFSLQQDARYHDGSDFDAAHVVFALKRLLSGASGSPQKALYQAISDVAAVDGATVKLTLSQPDARLLFKLGLPAAAIVAPESADDNRAVPLGTGPFAFAEWDDGQNIVLERTEDYWGLHPRINRATFVFMPDAGAAIEALLGDRIDGYPDFPMPAALDRLKGNADFRITTGKDASGKPRIGVWSSKLDGMWQDAPVEGCVLSDVRWTSDT
jgi:peptide/nickel transport system substrate-binding protein